MMRRLFGSLLVLFSSMLWLAETASGRRLSDTLGEGICQENYLRSTGDMIGDISCGSNADMYFNSSLILLFIFGVLFLFSNGNGLIGNEYLLEEDDEQSQG